MYGLDVTERALTFLLDEGLFKMLCAARFVGDIIILNLSMKLI
jgi:hypothetical protein